MVRRRIAGWRSSSARAFSMLPESGEEPTRRVPCASPAWSLACRAPPCGRARVRRERERPVAAAPGGRDARPGRRDGDAAQRAQPRRAGVGRRDRPARDPAGPADGQPVRDAGARPRHRREQPAELRAGHPDQLARLRRARDLRRARPAPVPGRHPADDAGRPGPDRQLRAPRRPSASRCCAGRSRRCTATRRAASSRCSRRSGRRAPERRRCRGGGGSYGSWTLGAKATGTARGVGYVIAAKPFRDRRLSRPQRGAARARRREVAIPLGAAHAHHVDRHARSTSRTRRIRSASRARSGRPIRARPIPRRSTFDTRKSIDQMQGGVALDHRFDADTSLKRRRLRRAAPHRAVPRASPARCRASAGRRRRPRPRLRRRVARSSSGGCASARRSLVATVGADYDVAGRAAPGLRQRRRPARRAARDEDDDGARDDVYARARRVADAAALSLTAGVRANEVRFEAADHYVGRRNPDDSGARTTTDARRRSLGVAVAPTDDDRPLRVLRRGLRDADLRRARLPAGRDRAQPRLDRGDEPRARDRLRRRSSRAHRVNVAVFAIDTRRRDRRRHRDRRPDDVSQRRRDAASRRRGRVGRRPRRGRPRARQLHVARRRVRRRLRRRLAAGGRARGHKLPGVPEHAAYAEVVWVPAALPWLELGAEVQYVVEALRQRPQHRRRAGVHDRATCARGVTQRAGGWSLRAFVRVNNSPTATTSAR